MTLWLSLVVMGVLAAMFVAWPLFSKNRNFTPIIVVSVLLVAVVSAGLYYKVGSPDVSSHESGAEHSSMEAAISTLATRLQSEPDDLEGWKTLGRSYMSLGNYAAAVTAFETAVDLESAENAQTLVELGGAMLSSSSDGVTGPAAAMFESALALEPNNAQALFYGGIAAFNRDDNELAASRWEILLGLNPPPEIEAVLRQRVAEWRGEAPPVEQPAVASPEPPVEQPTESPAPLEKEGVIIRATISLSVNAAAAVPDSAAVFVIARDPAQPSPPIAVVRRRVSELPVVIDLGDANSMVPGRSLSGFPEFELVARVSMSGQPVQQPGDWAGSVIAVPADDSSISLSIDTEIR